MAVQTAPQMGAEIAMVCYAEGGTGRVETRRLRRTRQRVFSCWRGTRSLVLLVGVLVLLGGGASGSFRARVGTGDHLS